MTPASSIKFPFERDVDYPLAKLKDFEALLSLARKADSDLSNELRAPTRGSPCWIKLRNEELIPVEYYAQHKNLTDTARFKIMPKGSKIDVQLNNSGAIEDLQITVADPSWSFSDPGSINHGGHYHRLKMELLNREGGVGGGPIARTGGDLAQDHRTLSTPELDAYRLGLFEAIERKLRKQDYEEGTVLLVYAREFFFFTDRFREMALAALSQARAKTSEPHRFRRIAIFDYPQDCYVESKL